MVNVTRTLTRAQIAKIVGNDQEAIRAFEALVATGQTVSATTFNLLVARVSSLEGRVDGLDVDVAALDAEVDGLLAREGISVIRTVTTTAAATSADNVLLADATAGSFTISLPTAATMEGRRLEIKKTDGTANTVTIDPDGAELIDGAAAQIISTQYSSRTVISDGTEWWIT